MTMVTGFFSALFWGALLLSLLVVIHEGGHFLAARAFGIRVTEFFIGMPCRFHLSFKSRKFGTEFGVTPILLGGYTRVCGMENDDDELLASALAIIQREGRADINAMSEELDMEGDRGYALAASLVDLASVRPYYNPELDEEPWQREWPRAFETLQRDANLLTEYDAGHDFTQEGTTEAGAPRPVDNPQAFLESEVSHTYLGKGFFPRIIVLLAGPLINILFAYALLVGSLMIGGVEVNANSNVLGSVVEGSYAEAAGLKGGDKILMIGKYTVSNWEDLVVAIDSSLAEGGDLRVAYERDGQTFETTIKLPKDKQVDLIGVNARLETYHLSFAEANRYAFEYMKMVGGLIARIIMPQHTMEIVSQSSSIVGISAMASQAAASGPNDLALLAAAISMSLGFTNLLPILPLDGGRIVVEIIQLIRGKPLSTKMQNAISYVGLALFLLLFCCALYNDITRLV